MFEPLLGRRGWWTRLIGNPFRRAEEPEGSAAQRDEVAARDRAAEGTASTETRFRGIFGHAAVGICQIDVGGRFMLVNRRLQEFFGRTQEELRSLRFADITHPDDLERNLGILGRALRGEMDSYTIEKRYIRKDGAVVWGRVSASVVRGEGGAPSYIISVVEDITAQKRAEDRLCHLNRELAHRVKNNLAALLSLCDQTLRLSPRPEDFAETFRARIHAMARVQDLLRQGIEKPIDLRALTARSLEGHIAGSAPAVHFREGPDVMLPPRAATVLSMALHELATNAVKHGALSTHSGRVDVRWEVKPEEGLRVSWLESGGPGVTPPHTLGFGAKLITGGVRHELGGRVEWLFEPTGVRCEIVVPPAALRTDGAHARSAESISAMERCDPTDIVRGRPREMSASLEG